MNEEKLTLNFKLFFSDKIKTEVIKVEQLNCVYDSRKSFYGKASVLKAENGFTILKSYESMVCVIDDKDNIYLNHTCESDSLFNQTTIRHIKEFIKQYSNHSCKFEYTTQQIKKLNNIFIWRDRK